MAAAIRYFYDMNTKIEVILSDNSMISYPLHNHISVFTVGMMLNGSILLTDSGHSKLYTPHQCFAILPYTPHSISPVNPYSLLSICISTASLLQYGIQKTKKDILNLLSDGFDQYNLSHKQLTLLLSCLDLYPELTAPHTARRSFVLIHSLKNQLEQFPENKYSIEDMAQASCLSKYHFIRSFKEEVGLTPHQFQLQNRIRKAQRLLCASQTMTEVAMTTGFCDQSHFIRQFQKYVGLTPSAYKQSLIQQSAGINLANR